MLILELLLITRDAKYVFLENRNNAFQILPRYWKSIKRFFYVFRLKSLYSAPNSNKGKLHAKIYTENPTWFYFADPDPNS